MSIKSTLKPIAMQSVDSATLGGVGVYQLLSLPAGLDVACVMIRIVNASNTIMTVSFDGVTDHDVVQLGTAVQLYAQPNAQPNGYSCLFGKGQLIYIAGAAGIGHIYLTGYFQPSI